MKFNKIVIYLIYIKNGYRMQNKKYKYRKWMWRYVQLVTLRGHNFATKTFR